MKYGLVVYPDTFNLGDDIQSYACEQFLPHTDYIINREKLDGFYTEDGNKVAVIMGGWYLYNHLNWPPSPFIKPLPISMHFDTYYSKVAGEKIDRNFVFEDYGATWLLENGPVGCRDYDTKRLIEKYGVPGYFSGCLTLTIRPFRNIEKHNKIILVDVSPEVSEYVKSNSKKDCIEEITHSVKMTTLEWAQRRKIVEERLKYYQGASLVVTTRLHAALPCLAMGVPVLLIKEQWSLNRTGTWMEYLNHTTAEKLISGEYRYDFDSPQVNPNKFIKVAEKLRERCEYFVKECECCEEEQLDVYMFLEGKKRVERLQRLMLLRVDKYEKGLKSNKI